MKYKIASAAFAALATTFVAGAADDPDKVADKTGVAPVYEGYELSWSDEFNVDGKPDPTNWDYELGYLRNNEAQEYTRTNAVVRNGALQICGCGVKNKDGKWHYTSASLISRGLRHFLYGRYEFRAKIPTSGGAWPVLWTMGTTYTWPWCGEIDVMEYFKGDMHGNWFWGRWGWDDKRSRNSGTKSLSSIAGGDAAVASWAEKYHVWRMDWTPESCKIYIDGVLFNEQDLSKTTNIGGDDGQGGDGVNPFRMPQYILMDIAMGGNSGGTIDKSKLPMIMEVDYVRCYKRKFTNEGMSVPTLPDTAAGTGAAYQPTTSEPARLNGYRLAWHDEFTKNEFKNGESSHWWVSGDSVTVANGVCTLTNSKGSDQAVMIHTWEKHNFTSGVIEVRARVPSIRGVYSIFATETLDSSDAHYAYMSFLDYRWLADGLTVGAWFQGDKPSKTGLWFGQGLNRFLLDDPKWAAKYHVWRYIVSDSTVKVTVDDVVISSKPRSTYFDSVNNINTVGNADYPHYLYLTLKLNTNEQPLNKALLPAKLEIDYVRCYEPGTEAEDRKAPSSWGTAAGFEGRYDGKPHGISVKPASGFTVEYGPGNEGPWSGENPMYVNAGEYTVWYRVTSTANAPVIGSKIVKITQAENAWTGTTAPTVRGWTGGESSPPPSVSSSFGAVIVSYSGTTAGGKAVSDATVIAQPGSYTAHFSVLGNGNYTGLSQDVDFVGVAGSGGVIATVVVPDAAVPGQADLRTAGTKPVFSITVKDGYAGVAYTAFAASSLSGDAADWTAVSSVKPTKNGPVVLDVERDASSAKFVKVVMTAELVASGTKLSAIK